MKNAALVLVILIGAAVVAYFTFDPFAEDGVVIASDAHVHGGVVPVGVRFDSRVEDLAVEIGDRVRAGDVLGTLVSDHLNAQVAEERARVERARVAVQAAQHEAGLDNIQDDIELRSAEADAAAAEAAIASARASLQRSRREFSRARQLAESGAVSQARLDAAREALRTAEAELREREAERDALEIEVERLRADLGREDVRVAEVAALREELSAARAELALSRADVEAATLRAVRDGLVVDISARAGASVRPNDPIVTVWYTDQAWVRAWVDERDVPHVRRGQKVTIELDAVVDRKFEGVVEAVLVAPDGRERTLPGQPVSPLLSDQTRFAVRIGFAEGTLPLEALPGMSATVRIEANRRDAGAAQASAELAR